MVVPIMRSALS